MSEVTQAEERRRHPGAGRKRARPEPTGRPVDAPGGLPEHGRGLPGAHDTPLCVASRITGWCAHIMEQHATNRIIRPLASYAGPGLRQWGDS